MDLALADKVVLITGASGGIGRALAETFAAEGARLLLTGRERLARAVAFLCSPAAARYVSGQTLTIAGGMEGRVLWSEGQIDEAAVRARLAGD